MSEITKIKEDAEKISNEGEVFFKVYASGAVPGGEEPHIRVDLRHSKQIFEPFSSHRSLNPEIFAYVQSLAQYTSLAHHLTIEFHLAHPEAELEKRIMTEFVGNYSFDFDQKQRIVKRENRLIWIFLGIGIVILGLYGLLSSFQIGAVNNPPASGGFSVGGQILSIASWVFIWEAFDRILFDRPEERRAALRAGQLAKADVKFVYDPPVSKKAPRNPAKSTALMVTPEKKS